MADSNNEEEHESPTKKQRRYSERKLKTLLQNFAADEESAEIVLEKFSFLPRPSYTKASNMLRDTPLEICGQGNTGIKATKIPEDALSLLKGKLFDLTVRPSRLYVERPCYPRLFDSLMDCWSDKTAKIVVTGNAGIGKSWFQVYFLQRLLKMTPNERSRLARFILRQYEKTFSLLDLETCEAWEMFPAGNHDLSGAVQDFMSAFNEVLYLFEPGQDQTLKPLNQARTPSLSTLAPNPNRLKGYRKEARPLFFYMPNWEFADLDFVSSLEDKDGSFDLNKQYYTFGGIIRRTLDYNKQSQQEEKDTLDKRIAAVDIKVIRSMHLGLDDSSDAQMENNISGYICAYDDIQESGDDAFSKHGLTMTSQYARVKVRQKLSLDNPMRHGQQLLDCLDEKAQDISGMDLETTAVYLLSIGPGQVKWEYSPVGQTAPVNPVELGHRMMQIHRKDDNFDIKKVNYPTNPVFGLVDFFIKLKGVFWGFQTTWQSQHPFKLRTLWSLRAKIGANETTEVNILYVVATGERMNSYTKRPKMKFLENSESLSKAIMENNEEVLSAEKVRIMWENTHIYVSYPKGKDWRKAVKTWVLH
jgi:hypothetical protein